MTDLFSYRFAVALGSFVLCAPLAGCRPEPQQNAQPVHRLPAVAALDAPDGGAIVAQGQLRPAAGLIRVMAPPGDRVAKINVEVGDTVEAGQPLVELASLAVRTAELAVAEAQLQEAQQRVEAETAAAEARVDAARIKLQTAESQLQLARAQQADLGLLDRSVELAERRLEQLRSAASNRQASAVVNQSTIDEQELRLRQAQSERDRARQEAQSAVESAELAVQAATKELQNAQAAVVSASAAVPVESSRQQIELLKIQIDEAQLPAPIDGTVVSVDTSQGAPTGTQPLLRLADTSRMICEAEVDVAELPRLRIGARAKMVSPALRQPLSGTVSQVAKVVGSPILADPDPLARVDWRSVPVRIDIDSDDVARAAELIHLQVDVAIEAAEAVPDERIATAGAE